MLKNNNPRHILTKEDRMRGSMICSQNKKLAAKLRELKKKGMTDDVAKRMYGVMTDASMSALDIRAYIEEIKLEVKNPAQMISLANVLIHWHKTTFGEKKIESQNMNLNVNMDMLKYKDLLKKYENEE